jgi:magnesium-transporting ATPase (P-type)
MTTEAALPGPATIAAGPATVRSVGRCILLTIVSFGLWSFAWIYHTADEVSPAAGQDASPPLRTIGWLIPIVNIVVLFLSWRDIDNFLKKHGAKDVPVIVFLLLTIFIPFAAIFTYIIVQNRLNDGWAVASGGQATDAPMTAVDWVFVLAGWVVLGLGLLFVIL